MQQLKANTQVVVTIGPFVDITDGLTPETGITLSGADEAELIKHGATTVVDIAAATWAAVTSCDGYYSLTLTTAHTDTEGMLTIVVQDDSVCLPVRAVFQVLSEAAYDSLYAAKDTGYMDINVKAISEDETAADNAELAFDGTGYGFTNCTIPTVTTLTGHTAQTADHTAGIANIPTVAEFNARTLVAADYTVVSDLGTVQTGDSYARLGAAGVGLTAIPWNSAWDAEVRSECADALTAYAAPTKTEMDSAFTEIKGATWASGTDTLEAIRDRGDAEWVTATGFATPTNITAGTITTATNLTNAPTAGDLTAAMKTSVNSEVADVVKTDTISEMSQGIPPSTPTLEEAIMYIYMALRNKIDVDAALKEFYNDAGTVIWKKSLSDDSSNYIEAKGASGP